MVQKMFQSELNMIFFQKNVNFCFVWMRKKISF